MISNIAREELFSRGIPLTYLMCTSTLVCAAEYSAVVRTCSDPFRAYRALILAAMIRHGEDCRSEFGRLYVRTDTDETIIGEVSRCAVVCCSRE